MIRCKLLLASIVMLVGSVSTASAQLDDGQRYTIIDGAVDLVGEFRALSGIEATSTAGALSLETLTIPGTDITLDLTAPFIGGTAVINSPNHVVIGVLGEDNRIDIEGTTKTSILYSQPLEVAVGGDLEVFLGLGDNRPTMLPGSAEDLSRFRHATIVDGRIALVGKFDQVAGIQATSAGSLLALDALNVPGVGSLPETAPFSVADGTVLAGDASGKFTNLLAYGVLGADRRIDIEGTTLTSMRYRSSIRTAAGGDLTVDIGLAECNGIPSTVPIGLAAGMAAEITCDGGSGLTNIGGPIDEKPQVVGRYASVVNGAIRLNGTFTDLVGIRAASSGRSSEGARGGFLSLEPSRNEPFGANGRAIQNEANGTFVSIGVLEPSHRITIEGSTRTSILYADSASTALDDLMVDVKLQRCGDYASLPVGAVAGRSGIIRCNGGGIEVPDGGGGEMRDFVVVDGAITLNGAFERLRSIEAFSDGGHLSLESVEVDGQIALLNKPFNVAMNAQIESTPSRVLLGVFGEENRINIEGETRTSILYSESQEFAYAGDLRVQLDHDPIDPEPNPGVGKEFITLVDGRLALQGTFKQLAGIEAISELGLLSLDSVNIPNVGDIDLVAPFVGGTVVAKEAGTVVLGVLGADKRIDIEGVTLTSILYSGDEATLAKDLTVNLGLGDATPSTFPLLPEPSSNCLALVGLACVAACRRSRSLNV